MAGRITQGLDRWHQARVADRWAKVADRVATMDTVDARSLRSEAKDLRRKLDRVVQATDARLAAAVSQRPLPKMPLGTDWSWRPDVWRVRLADAGAIAKASRTPLGDGLAVYHDCPLAEVVVRQIANEPDPDLPAFGVAIDVFGFRGTFLSLAMNLPEDAVSGFHMRHLVNARMVIDHETGVRSFARLNIQHGPNQAQPVSALADDSREKLAEFDLAYADLNEKRVERAWLDLILNDVAMTRIVVRDMVVSRRPRAAL